jgi:hypothetical protein
VAPAAASYRCHNRALGAAGYVRLETRLADSLNYVFDLFGSGRI